ncbi:ABC transporter substrate-binding protein [Marinomonas sp. 15G1-11]|uniref:ABC transporter substrate-binding protein n=1 Tax=Marinomonas phaeophyticola TaxID=3004091 RepID=A0ABT4JQN4_9GAMM|nr:ABC transporter substrate-binding protein [Marinomonas sp. 15G1-11]MCZ2720332.1 ABC transporter substrate-binding protein [Marinomonas sp. 15G1-11]
MKKLFALSMLAISVNSVYASDWQSILDEAKGQTVHFNAWGGAENINDYIEWAGNNIQEKYGVTLKQIKLVDTADAIGRVLAEKAAGNENDGSIDLIWLNGENFRSLKDNNFLYGPFSTTLPNYRYIDEASNKSLTLDFGTPVDGMEAPWGKAQVIFIHDTEILPNPPRSMPELLAYAKANPGRITYPEPPQFLGTTFLKQALYELIEDKELLSQPVENVDFKTVTKPLWTYLNELHPVTWRSGTTYPASSEEMIRLLDDQEIDLAFSFDTSAASVQISKGNLSDTVRSYIFDEGTISNTHFLAIPYNSTATAGAQVVANYFLSPEAQLKKQDSEVWGDLTVLSYEKLEKEQQALFDAQERGMATLTLDNLSNSIPEPHSSWVKALENEWRLRYAN